MANFDQYEKKNGDKAWKFQAYLGTDKVTGKPIKTTRRNFKTKKEAQLALAKLQVDFEQKGLEKDGNETFQQVYDLWLYTYKTTVKEVTFMKTEIKFRKWILPKYGDLRVNKVTVRMAQEIINQWAKETDQYRILHSTAKRVFEYAINLGIITNNPLSHIMMPKREKQITTEKVKAYTKEEVKKISEYLQSKSGTYRSEYDKTLMRFLFYTGCRISEALALNWNDINFDEKTVTINKILSQTKHGYKVSSPKTDTSTATISVDDVTLSFLKKWQLNQKEFMLHIGLTNPEMIFCGIYKQIITHHAIYVRLQTITEKVGVPFLGIHVTRHTHASLLLDAGASLKDVQDRLRHASIKITMDTYGHLSKETKVQTVDKFVKHLNA